ncbi:MAG: hypothetical protein BJ554DRAFT_3772 [Olpidium bornovanus]|uniref:Uncharacterized protein n=1 Tax=Olpidium bornovanus TaxID=278681 RepID=A0A8H7ZP45_9FUNG|nr:MAG: hypothetical protein BJ554DRAFT_3772 [Olpidium bornovanus]
MFIPRWAIWCPSFCAVQGYPGSIFSFISYFLRLFLTRPLALNPLPHPLCLLSPSPAFPVPVFLIAHPPAHRGGEFPVREGGRGGAGSGKVGGASGVWRACAKWKGWVRGHVAGLAGRQSSPWRKISDWAHFRHRTTLAFTPHSPTASPFPPFPLLPAAASLFSTSRPPRSSLRVCRPRPRRRWKQSSNKARCRRRFPVARCSLQVLATCV